MKRTIELILTVIGLLFSLLGLVLTAVAVFFANSDFIRQNFEEGYRGGSLEGGATYNPGEADMLLNVLISFGWVVVGIFLIGVVLGAIAIFFYTGNKKPKAASIIMIIAAVIVGIGTVFTGFLPALLYLIAGIVGLVRKPPINPEVTEI